MKGGSLTKKLGIIGGLGPFATSYFFELVLRMTAAENDQEHLEMIIYNCPSIPDRTAHILGKSRDTPLIPMLETGNKLVSIGVEYIALPCITAHFYYALLARQLPVPIIHMIRETALILKDCQVETAGLLATEGTIFSKIFQDELKLYGIRLVTPSKNGQEMINRLIYDEIKAGRPCDPANFYKVSDKLKEQGCQVIIIGCTELSLVKRDYPVGTGFLDAMEVLASRSILSCGGKLKNQYLDLITKETKIH